jgi:hypothetical protein
LKEIICLLEVEDRPPRRLMPMDWRPSSAIVGLCNLHSPPLHQVHKARVPQAVLRTRICVKANSSEHFIRYGSINKGPFNLNLPAIAGLLQPHENNLSYHNEERYNSAKNTLVGPCVGKENIKSRPQRSPSFKLPQMQARYHTRVSPSCPFSFVTRARLILLLWHSSVTTSLLVVLVFRWESVLLI